MKKNLIILLFSTLLALFNCNKSHYSYNMESYSKAETTPFLLNYHDEKEDKSDLEEGSAFILGNKIYNFGYNKKMYRIKSWPSYCKYDIMRKMHDINYIEDINTRKSTTDRVLQITRTLGVLKNESKILGSTNATMLSFNFNNSININGMINSSNLSNLIYNTQKLIYNSMSKTSLKYLDLKCNAFKLIKKKFNIKHVNKKDEFISITFTNATLIPKLGFKFTKSIWDPTPKVKFIKDKDDSSPTGTEIMELFNIIYSIYNIFICQDIIKLIILYKQIENYVDLRLCAHIFYMYNKNNDNQYEYYIKKSDKKLLELTSNSTQILNSYPIKNNKTIKTMMYIKVLKKFWYAGIHLSNNGQNGLIFYGKNKENKSYQPCMGQNETIYYEPDKINNSKLPKLLKPSKLTFREIDELNTHKATRVINLYRKNKKTNHIEKIKLAVINFVWHLTSFDEHGKATKVLYYHDK